MNEYPDNELINLVCENSEEARNVLYEKYSYIVDIIYNKYKKSAYYLSIDLSELRQEAMVGFSDAIANYNQDRESSLSTFISLCVERKVRNYVRNSDTLKTRMLREAYSLDSTNFSDIPLKDMIGDNSSDPQVTLEQKENLKEIKEKIDNLLSPAEKEVYKLMINDFSYEDIASILNKNIKQIYNTSQRIRVKIKDILN